jgi:hypothetical protein
LGITVLHFYITVSQAELTYCVYVIEAALTALDPMAHCVTPMEVLAKKSTEDFARARVTGTTLVDEVSDFELGRRAVHVELIFDTGLDEITHGNDSALSA